MGTILGKHSLGETRDLLAKTTFRFWKAESALNALIAHAIDLRDKGTPINADALGEIANDWGVLFPKWKADEKRFTSKLDRLTLLYPLNSDATISAEDVWSELVLYLRPEPNDFVKGTLPDIIRRIEAMGQPVDLSGEPQGTATDFDFDALKKSTVVTKAIETTAAGLARDYWPLAVLGIVVAGVFYLPELRAIKRLVVG
jgi:hypothetical protein